MAILFLVIFWLGLYVAVPLAIAWIAWGILGWRSLQARFCLFAAAVALTVWWVGEFQAGQRAQQARLEQAGLAAGTPQMAGAARR